MEDVSFMHENGETETHVIFVDSSQRDTVAYPNPAEYRIPFEEPLRNVVGVDVLDSVVPSTMYVVDEHNRDIRMYFIATTTGSTTDPGVARHRLFLPNLSSYLKWWLQLEDRPQMDPWSTAKDNLTSLGVMDINDTRIPVNDQTGAYVLPLRYPDFELFQDVTSTSNDRRLSIVDVTDFVVNVEGDPPQDVNGNFPTVTTILGKKLWIPYEYGFDRTRSMLDFEGDRILMLTLAYAPSVGAGVYIACHRLQFPRGNYGTLKIMMTAGRDGGGGGGDLPAMTPVSSTYLSAVSTDEDRLLQVKINAKVWGEDIGGRYIDGVDAGALAAFDMGCGMSEVLGFSGSLSDPGVVTLDMRAGQTRVKRFFTNQVGNATPTQYLYPTGVVNLTGERYIILRCEEVEAGMFAQSSTGNRGTGIGLFKLPGPGALREQRQDYITVVKRPFHPIGRVDGLTLRMERGRAPGTLYNFKGVNHLLVMAVKVMVPRRNRTFTRSVLNPNYDNDFLAYSLRHRLNDSRGQSKPMTPAEIEYAMRRHEFLTARGEAEASAAEAKASVVRDDFDDGYDTESGSEESADDGRWVSAMAPGPRVLQRRV
jgi:hypothetical protein